MTSQQALNLADAAYQYCRKRYEELGIRNRTLMTLGWLAFSTRKPRPETKRSDFSTNAKPADESASFSSTSMRESLSVL